MSGALWFMGWLRNEIEERAWWLALLLAAAAVVIALTAGPEVTDVTPLRDDKTVRVVPASGEQGFPVEAFCLDKLTKVSEFPAPDSSGVTYQLLRVKDGVTESVIVSPGGAKRYWDAPEGQQSEPAFVTAKAEKCISDKAK